MTQDNVEVRPSRPPSVRPGNRGIGARPGAPLTVGAVASTALFGCGGGAGGPATVSSPSGGGALITDAQAARFLAQASTGGTRAQMARVQALGYSGWLDEQMALPLEPSRWDWLLTKGYGAPDYRNTQAGFDPCAWRKLICGGDTLRQRMTLALSEIIVVGIDGLNTAWRQFAAAAWLDLLETHAFGNLRTLLGAVSRHSAMGVYLTFRGNAKANPARGTMPDENYARELLQLFMIGLHELQDDGTPRWVDGQPAETYTQDDITGLARVFTGWDFDLAGGTLQTPDHHRRPMTQVASRHEAGAKTFLGLTIPAGVEASSALEMTLDHLFAHPNVPAFWSRQLIQRLVTSNPSPGYVRRVARVFVDDGQGRRGQLGEVLRAILLDDEARSDAALDDPLAGKLREPILRLTAWARAFGATSPSDDWAIGNTSDAATRLGQSPLRSPSVFNFFRPGYVPPNSEFGSRGLVAPEFQITHESSVVGYVNFMQGVVANGRGDVRPDYSSWMTLADDAAALVAELDMLLAAGQLGATTRGLIAQAVTAMAAGDPASRNARVRAAVLMVMASPEYLVLK